MTNNWVQCPTCSKCNFQIVVVINHRLSSGAIIPGDRLHPQWKTLSTISPRLGQDSGHYCCPAEVIVVSLLCPSTPCQPLCGLLYLWSSAISVVQWVYSDKPCNSPIQKHEYILNDLPHFNWWCMHLLNPDFKSSMHCTVLEKMVRCVPYLSSHLMVHQPDLRSGDF